MDALQEIKSILFAMGARPEIINGETVKINAPAVEGGNNEKSKSEKTS